MTQELTTFPVDNGVKVSSIDYKALLQEQADTSYQKVEDGQFWHDNVTIVSESAISMYAKRGIVTGTGTG